MVEQRLPDWVAFRRHVERGKLRHGMSGPRVKNWSFFYASVAVVHRFLRHTFFYKRLYHNALHPRVVRKTFFFDNLPQSFDGFRILHITDLHLDRLRGLEEVVAKAVGGLAVDIAVLTGDYQDAFGLDPRQNQKALQRILSSIQAKGGIYCTLGNHDGYRAAAMLEELGAQVLINESATIRRDQDEIFLTGLDDVHYFYTIAAERALRRCPEGFRILAVHSPEMYRSALRAGYDLYLAGHTHGGQVCLPFGIPILTHAKVKRSMVRGPWAIAGLQGYTNRGAGTSGFPIRLNCPGEILLMELKCAASRGKTPLQ